MKVVLSVILLFAVLWPHAGVSQTTATSTKISCPQCGIEVKAEASFCPQCGASLSKLVRTTDHPASPRLTTIPSDSDSTALRRRVIVRASDQPASPRLATVPSDSDSTALRRREMVRMLLADPEFDRMLTQKIQRAVQQAPASSKDFARYERHSDPLGGFLKTVGGITCGLILVGLLASP